MEEIDEIVDIISELENDATVPRNVKEKFSKIIGILKSNEELSIKVNKALNEMDDISDDTNIQPYTRTQLWNIVSTLEKYA
ncbi:UPF0147 family protein [Nanoarchaeota archaeon]